MIIDRHLSLGGLGDLYIMWQQSKLAGNDLHRLERGFGLRTHWPPVDRDISIRKLRANIALEIGDDALDRCKGEYAIDRHACFDKQYIPSLSNTQTRKLLDTRVLFDDLPDTGRRFQRRDAICKTIRS